MSIAGSGFSILALGNGNPEHLVVVCKSDKKFYEESRVSRDESQKDIARRAMERGHEIFNECLKFLKGIQGRKLRVLKINFMSQLSNDMHVAVAHAIAKTNWRKTEFIVLKQSDRVRRLY